MDEDVLYADGFEEAFIGYSWRFNDGPLATYDRDKCIEILMRDMDHDEAVEYFEFNVVGAWVGEWTPVFVSLGTMEIPEEDEE
jgi:hypothetical protein